MHLHRLAELVHAVALNGVVPGHARHGVRTPAAHAAHAEPPAGVDRGLVLSRQGFLENGFIQGLLGDQLLQPSILTLEILELLRLRYLHAAVLLAPTLVAFLGYPQFSAKLTGGLTAAQHELGLAQQVDDLLCLKVSSSHDLYTAISAKVSLTERSRSRGSGHEGANEYPASHLYPCQSFGLGFSVVTVPGQSQVISSAGEYSLAGIADTKFAADPQEDFVAIVMTQLVRSP